ncbi:hypothetical protein D3C75_1002880 [compost metagenome]
MSTEQHCYAIICNNEHHMRIINRADKTACRGSAFSCLVEIALCINHILFQTIRDVTSCVNPSRAFRFPRTVRWNTSRINILGNIIGAIHSTTFRVPCIIMIPLASIVSERRGHFGSIFICIVPSRKTIIFNNSKGLNRASLLLN